MRGVDLRRWRFDWDLTFSVLVAHDDGTILHRYGGRDVRGAEHWLNEASYLAFLNAGIETHRSHQRDPKVSEPLAIEQVPAFAKKDKGDCIHCHSVFPSLHAEARQLERFGADDLWVYPSPTRVGLDLDPEDQRLVTEVREGSPAAAAGLKVGERLRRIGDVPVATASDVMFALHEASAEALELSLLTDKAERKLVLEEGWKRGTPLAFSWRPSKWELSPGPGFGGRMRPRGGAFAFEVTYLVDWGPNRQRGVHARKLGLRKGDLVLGTSVERDFESVDHFHAWWRLTRRVGEEFDLIVWREGAEHRIPWTVIE